MESLMRYIKRISRCFTLYRGRQLEETGINGYQHSYLLLICDRPGISQEQLAERLYVNKSNVTRQLASLEQGGFIRREADPVDRRQLRVYPTERAEALIPAIRRIIVDWNDELLAGLSDTERKQLFALLRLMAQRAAERTGAKEGEKRKL